MSETSTTSTSLVTLESKEVYGVITLRRPEKRNAMNREARAALLEIIADTVDKYKVLILTGAGAAFCAGIDLKERQIDRAEGIETAPEEWRSVNLAIRRHPAVFIAAVNGPAFGGGVTLINACDLAIIAAGTEIALPEIGFATYAGLAGPSTQLTVSRKRAAWMLLTGSRIDAQTALQWGIVNEVVALNDLYSACDTLASKIAGFDATALRFTKRALDRIPHPIGEWEAALEYGEVVNASIRERSHAQATGVAEFTNRKK